MIELNIPPNQLEKSQSRTIETLGIKNARIKTINIITFPVF